MMSNGKEIEWDKFFAPIKRAPEPARIVIVLDVCWGTSPTIAAFWTTPADRRPAMIFGPARDANRAELDGAIKLIADHMAKNGIPDIATAKKLVDYLNGKYPSAAASGTPFCRVWFWDAAGAKRYPEITKDNIRRI